ncbi:MAG: phytanoyl-CoA dioxygenase family protein [Candidatus Latescibacterota bacterium]|nr:phytanoyl-CoA dioxygenase family protein [Candidatus Latescibacterota bacterium]
MRSINSMGLKELLQPTELEEYLFDLQGYLHLKQAVDTAHVDELNTALDTCADLEPDQWRGNVHRFPMGDICHMHNIFEVGEPFERLIDHPSWIHHLNRFAGSDGLFIDESFADIRGPGTATRIHSGAHKRRIRTQFRYHDGQFRCGQINILLALTDFGPGDGATMVIPGSHKSNLIHPAIEEQVTSLDEVTGAVEVPLKAGDVAFFVDCLAHGSALRTNPGERRMLILRYGPHWGNDRYGYQPSVELISRLTPERRKIVQPLPPKLPPEAAC